MREKSAKDKANGELDALKEEHNITTSQISQLQTELQQLEEALVERTRDLERERGSNCHASLACSCRSL
jgi:septal ring factor EnvC (AmiA/AmiB activator)